MTNKFKIGDIVRERTIAAKLDANGNYVFRKNGAAVETNVWSDYTLEIVAVPDGKRKRYGALRPNGDTYHFGEKALEFASTISVADIPKRTASGVRVIG